ncbi:NAD(P)H azoreductase [Fusarium mexicanum]|uniref:NAD(P)H azoreductase n=1 Tax=Fusarium mexicanum TaxID=751941 RepID=A0A8H5JC57_9HYPO|nr:NAD(P)H azoreductase [Fusarium mexicanum]
MKIQIIFVVLLKRVATSPENDVAPIEAETYCVTYLSTYLAAIPNNNWPLSSIDGDANVLDTEDGETGRFPLAPSIRPTFGGNTSIATTNTNAILTQVDEETSQLAEFVTGPSSVDLPPSRDQARKTPSALQTSFGQTTLAVPTTTGGVEPQGQIVIFRIQLPIDDRKNKINKREVRGFVGNGSPDTCTFAATFNLAESQLFKNGNPIYYSGEEFKELDSQGLPPPDAITKGFASTGTLLSFQNDGLPNGEAGFCQTSDGQVYITFASSPPGCTLVTLGVYDAVEPPTSSFGLTTLEHGTSSSYGTLSSIEVMASTTSLEIDETTSEFSVISISESSSSELAESTVISDNLSTTLATVEASSKRTTKVSTVEESTTQTNTTPDIPTTTVDACVAGIASAGGSPPLQDRLDDCEEFNVVTVSPYSVTVTTVKKRWEYRIPTGWPTARPTNRQLVRRQGPDATTIFPSETPAYATYCDSAEDYYDACSSAGVTAVTTTLPTPTETETDEEPACRAASMVKRAGEGLGYQFEEDWDVIRMPGWRYF